jgi:hypothetical protein
MYSFRIKFFPTRFLLACILVLFIFAIFEGTNVAAPAKQKTFITPEAAVATLIQALRNNSEKDLLAILGPGSENLISSGDQVEDKKQSARFIKLYDEKNFLENAGDRRMILHVGNNDWPFPIPIVKTGNEWRFDIKLGKEEILSRRIGRNELNTIQTCLAIVDAEREYATRDRDGSGLLEYAQKFFSDMGKKNGLYWEAKPGEKPSPLGLLVAKAQGEGHRKDEKPAPYDGYFFRILTAQGKDANGGAYSYVVKGKMIGGFALVAYPASYGVSGVNTFIVNHEGVVYQKDLGPDTAKKAKSMKEFNPDKTWGKAE